MHDLLTWYIAVLLLGLAAWPLAATALAHLPDRGWALSKPLAILLIGFLCWWPPVVFHAWPYTRGWILLVALTFVAGNVVLVFRRPAFGQDLLDWLRQHWLYALICEALFAGTLRLVGYLRALNPQVQGTEKYMDQAFLSSIIRAQHLPPPDPWLSGYPINYYYFGHYLIATLAKLLGTSPAVAFNCGIALTAALVASAVFGVAANLTVLILRARPIAGTRFAQRFGILSVAAPCALFAVLAELVMGNLLSFQMWWRQLGPAPSLAAAWTWLHHPANLLAYDWWDPSRAIPNTITEFPDFSFLLADLHAHALALPYTILAVGVALNLWLAPPRLGLRMFGERWDAAATVTVAGLSLGALYLLNGWDLPTYLGLALIALVLHQWNAGGRALSPELGVALAWTGGALLAVSIIPYLPFYLGFTSPGQGIGLVTGTANHIAIPLAAPPADIAAHPESRTAIGDEIGANGVMLFIFGSWLLVLLAQRLGGALRFMALERVKLRLAVNGAEWPHPPTPSPSFAAATDREGELASRVGNTDRSGDRVTADRGADRATTEGRPYTLGVMERTGGGSVPALPQANRAALLPADHAALPQADHAALPPKDHAAFSHPDCAPRNQPKPLSTAVGRGWGGAIPVAATASLLWFTWLTPAWDGWTLLWALLFMGAALYMALEPLFGQTQLAPEATARMFPLLLVAFGAGLIGLCEVVFLRDVFVGGFPRMNTVFKAYFQVWTLFALASAPALAWLVSRLGGRLPTHLKPWQPVAYLWRGVWAVVALALVAVTLIYPFGASHTVYALDQKHAALTLDGMHANYSLSPGDVAAIDWLNGHVQGSPVIAEANDKSEYNTTNGRVAVFTGLPTIIGWLGHEYQWRVTWLNDPAHAADYNARLADLDTIYTSPDQATVQRLLRKYHVRYVFVGALEWQTYGAAGNLGSFTQFLPVVYQRDGVTIYAVPNA